MNTKQASQAEQTAQNLSPTAEKLSPSGDLIEAFRQYARERPEVVAIWCLGVGFVLGWKLKIW